MDRICFIIDSMSTTSKEIFDSNNIEVFNYCVNDINGNLIYDDFTNEQKSKIIDEIENKKIIYKTSFLPNIQIEEKINQLLKKYKKIIYLCASEGYTGQYLSAKSITDEPKYKDKVFIINTHTIASTIESILFRLIDFIKKNDDINIDQINNIIDETNKQSIILFTPKNLIGMVNSGRVPLIIAKLMKLTKIHPIIKCEEKNKATGLAFRKWNEAIEKICDGLKKIFKNKINNENIEYIYFYCSLITKQEINEYVEKISSLLNIDKSIIKIRNTPLPILIYTLKDSIGVGITLKGNNYKD